MPPPTLCDFQKCSIESVGNGLRAVPPMHWGIGNNFPYSSKTKKGTARGPFPTGYFANSLFFSQVAMMASVIAERKPPFSRARTPWMVEPPGEQTASFILPGWSPL